MRRSRGLWGVELYAGLSEGAVLRSSQYTICRYMAPYKYIYRERHPPFLFIRLSSRPRPGQLRQQ